MALSRFQLVLPERIMQLPCHLTWIKECIPNFGREVVLKESVQDLKAYLSLLLRENSGNSGMGCEEEEGGDAKEESLFWEMDPRAVCVIGHNLNRASFYAYVGDFNAARYHLEQVRKKVEESEKKKEELEGDRLRMVRYCLDAAELAVKVMEDSRFLGDVEGEVATLLKKWEDIEGSQEAKATVAFLQGLLANELEIDRQGAPEKFLEAANLDPEYHIWNHYAYRFERNMRRSGKKMGDGGKNNPSKRERHYCKKSYDLRPGYLPAAIDWALLHKDLLWGKRESDWEEDDVQECDTLFKEALQIAKCDETKDGKFWIHKLKIYYGEFLVFGRHPSLDQGLGKQLFDESVKEHPTDPFVLHKVAKLYHQGAYSCKGRAKNEARSIEDLEKAESYYRTAVGKKWNYPCFTDYLRFLKEYKKYEDIIRAFNEVPSLFQRDLDVVRLLVERGCITWLQSIPPPTKSKEEACRLWISALVKYPEHAEHVYDAFKRFYKMGHRKPTSIWRHMVITTLKQLKTSGDDEVQAISSFVDALQKQLKDYEKKKGANHNPRKPSQPDKNDDLPEISGRRNEEIGVNRHTATERRSSGNEGVEAVPSLMAGGSNQLNKVVLEKKDPSGNGSCLFRTPQQDEFDEFDLEPFKVRIGRGRAHFCKPPAGSPAVRFASWLSKM